MFSNLRILCSSKAAFWASSLHLSFKILSVCPWWKITIIKNRKPITNKNDGGYAIPTAKDKELTIFGKIDRTITIIEKSIHMILSFSEYNFFPTLELI